MQEINIQVLLMDRYKFLSLCHIENAREDPSERQAKDLLQLKVELQRAAQFCSILLFLHPQRDC